MRAIVLSNTAARTGEPAKWQGKWQARAAAIRKRGIPAMADAILDRWFGPDVRHSPDMARWKAMLTRAPEEGCIGCSTAIAGGDLFETTRGLCLPGLGIAGPEDGASAPAEAAATAAVVPNSGCETISGAGHLPSVRLLTPVQTLSPRS